MVAAIITKYHILMNKNMRGKTNLQSNKMFYSDDKLTYWYLGPVHIYKTTANLYNILKPWLHHIGVL